MIRAVWLAGLASLGCADEDRPDVSDPDDLADDLRSVAARRVLFLHHSVGDNILDGVRALSRRAGVDLPIRPFDSGVAGPGLYHGSRGENGNPLSKIRAFEEVVGATPGLDVALVKLCFIDVTPETDVGVIADGYRDAVARIRAERPGLILVHPTIPLMARPTDLQARLYRAVGRSVWIDASNRKRMALADRIRSDFAGEPILDITHLESRRPDGSVEEQDGVRFLHPAYTDDGAHLGPRGAEAVALELIRLLARAGR